MQWLSIVLLSILTAILYGILHDQITARICIEYFTIGHPPVFDTESPTLLGLGWGILATWWVGLILGIPLATSARLGRWPKLAPRDLLRPLLMLAGCSACVAFLAGLGGYIAACNRWVTLLPRMADRIPPEKHIPFLVDLWTHCGSYAAGVLGGIVLIVMNLLVRQRRHVTGTLGKDSIDP